MTGAARTPEELLTAVDLFAGLSKRDAKKFLASAREVTHVKGKRVTGEGDPGYGFHLIMSGRPRSVTTPARSAHSARVITSARSA